MPPKNNKAKRNGKTRQRLKTILIGSVIIVVLSLSIYLFISYKLRKPTFDGERAFSALIKQTEFGPRINGSKAHDETKNYLIFNLKQYADLVSEQQFEFKDRHDTAKIYSGTNIIASFNVSQTVQKRILLAAHWDTRPFADNDPDLQKRNLPVTGANDGASGVAVLLEMARLFSESKPDVGVDIIFFDLEDIGDSGDAEGPESVKNPFGIGSEMFVRNNPDYHPEFGILLDMVGDKSLRIPKEALSVSRASDIVEKVWKTAKKVGSEGFVDEKGAAVIDDHVPFLRKSIPVIDLIQTPFPKSWHTINDIPENCSSASLNQVGNMLVELIYSEKKE